MIQYSPLICLFFAKVFIILSTAQNTDVQTFGRCVTPTQENAVCVKLEDCQYLYKMLMNPPLNETVKTFLRRSQCPSEDDAILICCSMRQENVAAVQSGPKDNSLLPAAGECGRMLTNRIFGGRVTKINEYPWMAQIEYTLANGNKVIRCGGSLINKRYVLTASHCVNGRTMPRNSRLTSVRLGAWNTTSDPDCEVDIRGQKYCAPRHSDIRIELAIPHPEYDPYSRNHANDIALLRLQRNVEYTDFLRPICLPSSTLLRAAIFDDVVLDVAGWGRTETEAASEVKLKAAVKGIPLADCRRFYGPRKYDLVESQMCAGGEDGVDSCSGDSGGPLIGLDRISGSRPSYFLAGLVSFGPTICGISGVPGVYTRVGSYVDWIEENVKP